ncbi:Bifunctional dethiobiotin synthetase/7,8-diamino-pelargonic acid aminotransferase, mitochondrial [Cyphellophora attinorum]|uniref:Bifunctional dethiobiotin synthetase/7,8-diamino-pelargonic acid aminotransferase, mitochondrial n=1 Tax=Cyphellophora attinorum TaxID=1664694 RepID=A0A0N0NLW8_9EURO|nr:Bifunctional dethiobiotin synthetase/7,8-diamino-pelargonic acid aminotransferase, mitochondrial [Phialophora attinorum]KPI39781.1 Bifunctional dethiobiotin synthetase/7,8-diamino-pelargonic acid aminotransferase, mitochondrial [Phialophora attinorum]
MYFKTLSAIFDFDARRKDAEFYRNFIHKALKSLVHDQGRRFGALIMEPIIMGAGGMIFVDPLFQHLLITTIRSEPSLVNPTYTTPQSSVTTSLHQDAQRDWSGLPVIADEVFTGLYRLGRASSSSFLGPSPMAATNATQPLSLFTAPDISAHAKLLTGGLLPLSITTASDAIFRAFYSSEKPDALLHGHSYTAHPIGCSVANWSLKKMEELDASETSEWNKFRAAWSSPASRTSSDASTGSESVESTHSAGPSHWSVFPPSLLDTLSHHPLLSGVWSLGTVLALTMAPTSSGSGGYASNATASLQSRLLTTLDPTTGQGIHARVLGDVIYVMTSLTTTKESADRVGKLLLRALEEEEVEREQQ